MSGGHFSERKNVLVTGGAGFIGSHLCDRLIQESNVICVDDFITSSVANIDHLLREPHFEFINHDITQPLDLAKYKELERFGVGHEGIHEIYHLACPISKRHFDDYKIATVLTNSVGVKHVLDLAVTHHAKVLYASSSVLYGERHGGWQASLKETDECHLDHLTPHGAYDEGKRFSEAILQTYAEVYSLDIKIARVFRTYGPRMKIFDGNLIPDMILNALDDKDIVISGDEETRICLCYVKDVVDGLVRLMSSPIELTLANLGSDQEMRLVSVAQKILNITNSASRVRFDARLPRLADPGLPDISRAKDLLGWMPCVRLDDGLKSMVDYANSHKNQVTS
jgi:UDP-glucuronate decarboxylase